MHKCFQTLAEQYPYVKFCRIQASEAQMSHQFVSISHCEISIEDQIVVIDQKWVSSYSGLSGRRIIIVIHFID